MQIRLPSRSRRPGRRSGFTLAEALVATGIVGISFISLYSGLVQGDTIVRSSAQNMRATEIMAQKMEMIRVYTWDQITNTGYIPRTNTYYESPNNGTNTTQGLGITYTTVLSVSNAPVTESYAADLRQLTITVNWTSSTGSHQRQMTSYVSHYGMQNYIYTGK